MNLGLLRVCRCVRYHSHRGSFLVDAKVVGFALRKGKSAVPMLRRVTRAIAAILLAADLKLSFPYLPSKSNTSDYPSMGKVLKGSNVKQRTGSSMVSVDLLHLAYMDSRRRWERLLCCSWRVVC